MSEQTPLLESTPVTRNPSGSDSQDRRALRLLETLSVCISLVVLVEFGAYLATIPLNQVLEENICKRMHLGAALAPNDPRCKDKSVQSELSVIRGWQSTFDFIPGLLVAVPYGMLADKVGRGIVLTLATLGLTLGSGFYIFVCAYSFMFLPCIILDSAYILRCLPQRNASAVDLALGHFHLHWRRCACHECHDFHHCWRYRE